MECVIKSQETREGCIFRILKDDKYFFANLKFNNYFYVNTVDYEIYSEEIWRNFKFALGETAPMGNFTKITLINNFMRTKIKEFCESYGKTYEADIKANKRYLLDNNPELNNENIPFLFFDIETDDRFPMKKDESGIVIAQSRILSFSAVDGKGNTFVYDLNKNETDESEIALLTAIITLFSQYGIVAGWNSERFDMPYIKQRCDILGVKYNILEYINHLDYYELYKKYTKKSLKSYSLNSVSEEELGEHKIEQAKGNGAIYETWKNNTEQLLRYNLEDANLVKKINDKLIFIGLSMSIANICGCHTQNTMNNSDSGDFLLMRQYKKDGIIMPSKPTKDEVLKRKMIGKIGGGYTTCLVPGFHEKVDIFDFKSLYPSIMQTWNISPETYIETIQDLEGYSLDKEKYTVTPSDFENIYHPHRIFLRKEGIVPRTVKFLVDERDKTKYSMEQYKESDPGLYRRLYLHQYALKTLANSIYGILSFPQCRFYSWEMGDAVTTCARATIKRCYKMLEFWGCTVLGGDTDSTFVQLNANNLEDINEKFVTFLAEWAAKYNCPVNKLVFEHEKIYDPMLFVMKKGYAFKVNGKIGIKGLECIKSDTNPYAAKLQKDFILDVLNKTVDVEKWSKIVNDLYTTVYDQKLNMEDLLIIKALTKMPEDYKGYIIDKKTKKPKIKADGTLQEKSVPAHVKLADRMIKQGIDIYPGTKIKFIVIAEKPILAISPEEYTAKQTMYEYKSKKKGNIIFEWDGNYVASYYHLRLIKPLIKVIFCYLGKLPDLNWGLTTSQMNKITKNQEDEDDE